MAVSKYNMKELVSYFVITILFTLIKETFMKLIVDNMSCQHCVKTITNAIKNIDSNAQVTVDLAKKEVTINGGTISQEEAIKAIDEAGYQFVSIGY